MKVRIYGFALHTGKGITHDEFFSYLETLNGQEFDNRILTVAKQGDFWTGILITVKDWKAFCQFRRSGNEFTISAKELEEGTNMADFNFFAVYAPTGRGLYQHYHLSTHVAPFCAFLKKRYDELKAKKVAAVLEACGENTIKAERAAKARYAQSLQFAALCRKDTLLDRMKQWERVKSLEFQYETLEFQNDPLTPLSKVARTRMEKFTFGKNHVDLVKAGVEKFLGLIKFKGLRVIGVNPEGVEQVFKLHHDYDTFGEFDFNDLIRTVSMDSNDLLGSLKKSQIVTTILKIADGKAKTILTASASP